MVVLNIDVLVRGRVVVVEGVEVDGWEVLVLAGEEPRGDDPLGHILRMFSLERRSGHEVLSTRTHIDPCLSCRPRVDRRNEGRAEVAR